MSTHTRSTDASCQPSLDQPGRGPSLGPAAECRLARLAAGGDERARRTLVEGTLSLVVAIARRYRGLGLDDDDLVQEGNLGLIAAATRYEPGMNVRFRTFAGWCIRRAI